jgi:hypothetical protein
MWTTCIAAWGAGAAKQGAGGRGRRSDQEAAAAGVVVVVDAALVSAFFSLFFSVASPDELSELDSDFATVLPALERLSVR